LDQFDQFESSIRENRDNWDKSTKVFTGYKDVPYGNGFVQVSVDFLSLIEIHALLEHHSRAFDR